jgi:hypothetical protein
MVVTVIINIGLSKFYLQQVNQLEEYVLYLELQQDKQERYSVMYFVYSILSYFGINPSILTLMQIDPITGVQAFREATKGGSESYGLIIAAYVLVGFLFWRWELRQSKEDERSEKREEAQRQKDLHDSQQLVVIGQSTSKTADAMEEIAKVIKTIETRQIKHEEALIHTVHALQLISEGRNSEDHIKRAKSKLEG